MNKLAASLLVGAAGLFVSAAQAAPLTNGTPTVANDVESVRMICNENGRCWRERSSRTVVIERNRNSYNYYGSGRERHRHHHHHDHGGPGVGIHAPGVSIGVGGGNRW